MKIPTYHVNDFTDRLFGGNPAMVCILEKWLAEDLLQTIATENNLPATAFLVPGENHFSVRWFSPEAEIPLCCHGSLAAAYTIFNELNYAGDQIIFHYPQGKLVVNHIFSKITLEMPRNNLSVYKDNINFAKIFSVTPQENFGDNTVVCVFENAGEVKSLTVDFTELKKLSQRNIIVTAKGDNEIDFVSRNFYCKKVIKVIHYLPLPV